MDVIIEANKESVILTSLEKSLQTDVSYKIVKNYPNISRQLIEIQPNIAPSGVMTGKEIMFNLPRYGILTNLLIKSTIQSSTTNTGMITTFAPTGLQLFQLIELRSHNRVICTNTDAYLRVRFDSDPISKAAGDLYRYRTSNASAPYAIATAWAATTDYICYTPFRCSFFEDVRNHLDLNFIEQLQLRCVVNSVAGTGLTTGVSFTACTLWMWYYNMQSEALSALRARNFKPEKPLVMLAYDTYTETGTIASGATSTTITLNVNNAVFATHIFVRDNAAAGSAVYKAIGSYTVKLGGKTIYDTVPARVGMVDQDRFDSNGGLYFGSSLAVTAADGLRPVSIYWGLEENRTYNSGAVAFHNINNPQIVLVTQDGSGAYDYYIVHEYWSLVSVNSADGKIEVSSSV